MELSRISALLAVFLLTLCLSLTVCTVMVLRGTVEEGDRVRTEAEAFLSELRRETEPASASTSALPTNANGESFLLREVNGRVAIFTAEGELISVTEIAVALLPLKDRQALAEGIHLASANELAALLQDLQ